LSSTLKFKFLVLKLVLKLDKGKPPLHTGNETEGSREQGVGRINKPTNYGRWTIGNDQLAIVN
jgi:hypothetical protein